MGKTLKYYLIDTPEFLKSQKSLRNQGFQGGNINYETRYRWVAECR